MTLNRKRIVRTIIVIAVIVALMLTLHLLVNNFDLPVRYVPCTVVIARFAGRTTALHIHRIRQTESGDWYRP